MNVKRYVITLFLHNMP